MEYKHYIRLNEDGFIIKGFSNAFESNIDGDICINENAPRHFELLGERNPMLLDYINNPIYRYVNGQIERI